METSSNLPASPSYGGDLLIFSDIFIDLGIAPYFAAVIDSGDAKLSNANAG